MILYFYESNGRVRSKRVGSADNLKALLDDPDVMCVNSTADYPISQVLVSTKNELIYLGSPPSESHIIDFDNQEWVLDIGIAKQNKWNEIKAARTAQEFGSFEWGGYTFQCNEVSQRRIQGAVQLAMLDPTLTLDWTLADNTVQAFTAAEFEAIGQALAAHVGQCHERGRILRQEIDAATSESDLEAISW